MIILAYFVLHNKHHYSITIIIQQQVCLRRLSGKPVNICWLDRKDDPYDYSQSGSLISILRLQILDMLLDKFVHAVNLFKGQVANHFSCDRVECSWQCTLQIVRYHHPHHSQTSTSCCSDETSCLDLKQKIQNWWARQHFTTAICIMHRPTWTAK